MRDGLPGTTRSSGCAAIVLKHNVSFGAVGARTLPRGIGAKERDSLGSAAETQVCFCNSRINWPASLIARYRTGSREPALVYIDKVLLKEYLCSAGTLAGSVGCHRSRDRWFRDAEFASPGRSL